MAINMWLPCHTVLSILKSFLAHFINPLLSGIHEFIMEKKPFVLVDSFQIVNAMTVS